MPEVHLALPYRTLDDRINSRSLIAELRRDPNVLHLVCRPDNGALATTVTLAEQRVTAPEEARTFEIFDAYRDNRADVDPEPVPNQNGDAFPSLRQFFGSPQVEPLRRHRDYQATARPIFLVEQLPDGLLPAYQDDPVPQEALSDEPIPLLGVADPQDRIFMDQRNYDDLLHWASQVIQTKSVLPQSEVTAPQEPEPPTFWERLLDDE